MSKKKQKAKIARVIVKRVHKVADDHHVVELEAEVTGPLPDAAQPELLPVEITPDAPEPEKRGFWYWLFGE
jgi:hypothetical protein